jgi:hypothetical protein
MLRGLTEFDPGHPNRRWPRRIQDLFTGTLIISGNAGVVFVLGTKYGNGSDPSRWLISVLMAAGVGGTKELAKVANGSSTG